MKHITVCRKKREISRDLTARVGGSLPSLFYCHKEANMIT